MLVCLAAPPGCNRPPAAPDAGAASPDSDAAAEHATLGQAYFTEGDKARAAAEFSQAIAAQPTVAQHYADRAACLIHLGRTAAALADFDHAIKLDPDNPEHTCSGRWCHAIWAGRPMPRRIAPRDPV